MTELLEIYSKKIKNNLDNIGNKFAQCELCSPKEAIPIIKEIEEIINNNESLIKNYSLEIIMNHINTKSDDTIIFKETLSKYKLRLKKLKEQNQKDMYLKIYKKKNDYSDENIKFNSFNKLQNATRSSFEMQNMTGNILNDLNNQTSKMKGVNSKINNMNEEITSSTHLLTGMTLRQNQNKFMMIIFGFVLFILFIIIVIIRYNQRK